jgi:hypothetical protein
MTEHEALKGQLTTLKLQGGSRPFALSAEEQQLNGDWWAWQFLRRNPFYRHDFHLKNRLPDVLKWRENVSLKSLLGHPPRPVPVEIKNLDARLFCAHGRVLSGPAKWNGDGEYSLGDYRLDHPDLNVLDVYTRKFDSVISFGISQWFDPDEAELPKLSEGQSWFYCLTEPVWRVSDLAWASNISVIDLPEFGLTPVGIDEQLPMVQRKFTYRKYGKQLSPDSQPTYEIAEPPPQPLYFSNDSEMAFAVSLDRDIDSQIRPLKKLASSYQGQLRKTGAIGSSMPPPVGVNPLVMHPNQGPSRTIDFVQGLVEPEQRQFPTEHWRACFIDTRFALAVQFQKLTLELKRQQEQLGSLWIKPPKRVRNTGVSEFWLKKALTMLELQLNLPHLKLNTSVGAALIAQAILDPSHHLHSLARPNSGISEGDRTAKAGRDRWHGDDFKDALSKAKELSLGKYQLLVGMTAKDLYKPSS